MKELITTEAAFDDFIFKLQDKDLFALDVETNGKFSQFEVQLVGISVGWSDYGCYIPINHLEGEQLPQDLVLGGLKPFLLDENVAKIYHNAKFDEMVFKTYNIDIKGPLHDTMVMAWLYDEKRDHKLKHLVRDYLGYDMTTYDEVVDNAPRKRGQPKDYNFARVLLEDANEYAADDGIQTFELYRWLKQRLEEEGLWQSYINIEAPLVRVVRKMQYAGVFIDQDEIQRADEKFPKLMEEIETEVFAEAGYVFNLDAPQQVGEFLFEKMKIDSKPALTKTKKYQVNKDTYKLYSSRYPIVEKMQRRKKIKKTHGTFVEGLQRFIQQDGRVHGQFKQTGTVTGRFSSSQPNLQNQEGDEVEEVLVRSFFVPADGYKFVIGDYSQIELRLLAHLSKDENMLQAFMSGKDFHDQTARLMLEKQGTPITAEEEVTPRQRFHAKSLNFGIPYGRQDASIAKMLGIPQKCAHWRSWNKIDREWQWKDMKTAIIHAEQQEPCHDCGACFIEDWFAAFPRVRPYRDQKVAMATKHGFVRTLSGRKRRLLPEIRSNAFGEKMHAQRQAFNVLIQGSAGDIMKLAMVKLQPELEKLGGNILITVHDELLTEVPEDRAEEAVVIMKEVMENPFGEGKYPLSLPMIVKPKICNRWSEGK